MYYKFASFRRTGKERSHTECRLETCLFGNGLVFQAMLNIQRVREDYCLGVGDSLAIIEVADHLDKECWVSGVLTDTSVALRIGNRAWVSIALLVWCGDGLFEGFQEGRSAESISEGDSKNLGMLC